MAEDAEDDIDADEDGEAGEGGDAKKGGMKKLILFVGLPVVILLLGGVAGGLLLFGGGGEDETHMAEGEHGEGDGHGGDAAAAPNAAERYAALHTWPIDEPHALIDVNIEGEGGRMLVMQLGFVFVYEDPALDSLLQQDVVRQRITTSFLEFLRTLRAEDVYGSMGTFRIRAEMRRRANLELAPYEIEDVLIPELIIA